MKKDAGSSGLKIKKPLPDLQQTPDPEENATLAPKSLKIKSSSGAQNTQLPEQPKSLKIKSSSGAQDVQNQAPKKSLTIKSSSGAQDIQNQAPKKSLTIKSSSGAQDVQNQAPKKSLTIKSSSGAQDVQNQAPQKSLSIKAAPALQQPEPKVDLNATLAPENRKAPPPMPTGYAAPPPPANHSQGPIFPTQQPPQAQQTQPQQPIAYGNQKPQGPIFPTQASSTTSGYDGATNSPQKDFCTIIRNNG